MDAKANRLFQINNFDMPLELDYKIKLEERSSPVKCVDLHPTEDWVLVALYNGKVQLWHYETKQLLKTFEVTHVPVRVARFVPRKHWIVCGSNDFKISVYNYYTFELVKQFKGHKGCLRSIVIHPTEPYFISSSNAKMIKLWNWDKDFLNVQKFKGHVNRIMQVVINPKDSSTFASASKDTTIKVWQLGSPVANFTLKGHEAGVNCVDYCPEYAKPYLISGSADKTVKIWDYETKTCIRTLVDGHIQCISAVAFHPDLPIILSVSKDWVVQVRNMYTYHHETTLFNAGGPVWTIACKKNSKKFAVGYDRKMIVYELDFEEPKILTRSDGTIVWTRKNGIGRDFPVWSNSTTMPLVSFVFKEPCGDLMLGVKTADYLDIYDLNYNLIRRFPSASVPFTTSELIDGKICAQLLCPILGITEQIRRHNVEITGSEQTSEIDPISLITAEAHLINLVN